MQPGQAWRGDQQRNSHRRHRIHATSRRIVPSNLDHEHSEHRGRIDPADLARTTQQGHSPQRLTPDMQVRGRERSRAALATSSSLPWFPAHAMWMSDCYHASCRSAGSSARAAPGLSGIRRRAAIAPEAGKQCSASLVVAHDHDDSEHNHHGRNDLDDKPEASTLLAAALPVTHWPILAITGQRCGRGRPLRRGSLSKLRTSSHPSRRPRSTKSG